MSRARSGIINVCVRIYEIRGATMTIRRDGKRRARARLYDSRRKGFNRDNLHQPVDVTHLAWRDTGEDRLTVSVDTYYLYIEGVFTVSLA